MARHKTRQNAGRNIRLADQIQKDLAGIIQRELDVSRAGLITLTSVDLSPDSAHAGILHVLGAEPATAATMLNTERLVGLPRYHRCSNCAHIHTVPRLRFIHDEGILRGLHISQLIDQANRGSDDEALPPPDEPDERD